MGTKNRTTTQARDVQVLAGIQKDLTNVSSIAVAGSAYTMTLLTQLVQSRVDAVNAVLAARASLAKAIGTYEALDTKVTPLVRGIRQYVINAYGEKAAELADFGFTPDKRATQTTEEKAAAAAKRMATREARGTTGKKAKSDVTGETVKLAALQAQVAAASSPTAAPGNASALAPAATPTKA